MKLAINYSPAAAGLVKSGDIEIDRFKTPDWDWMIEEAQKIQPVAIHFNLEAGNGHLDEVDWEIVDRLAQATQTPYINLHLDPKQKHYPKITVESQNKSERKQIIKKCISDVKVVVNQFGPGRVIIENSPYRGFPGNTLRFCVEPEFISKVIDETGCGLLVDISHAVIASHYLGMDTYDYFLQLPIHKIRELHFAGIHKLNGVWVDHLSVLKKNWKWLDWVLSQVQSGAWSMPWLLAFEYGGVGKQFAWRCEPDVIRTQVPLILERVRRQVQTTPGNVSL